MIHVEQRELFFEICRKNHLAVSDREENLLKMYADVLSDFNRRINLVSRNDVDNLWLNHILHSISVLFLLDLDVDIRMLDIGSGGGLPGIPLAIIRDDIRFTLIESIKKKTDALSQMISALSLPNVDVINARAEVLGCEKEYTASFDAVIARAVAPLAELVKWSRNFLRPGQAEHILPCLLAYKGGDLKDEIEKARIKANARDIVVKNIQFDGIERTPLTGKKLVIVKV